MKLLKIKLFLLLLIFKISNNNTITITISGNGQQKILSDEYQGQLPNEIIINGDAINYSNNIINIDGEKEIILKWTENELEDMSYMFSSCSSIKFIDLSNIDTSKVTDMNHIFSRCTQLTSLNIEGFNTTKVNSMHGMFHYCDSLKSLDISNFDTSSVTTMRSMFSECVNLESLELNFDTSQVKTMSYMFNNCPKLKEINISSFDTSSVTSIDYMFTNCQSLISLNLNNFDLSSVNSMNNMFEKCQNLISLELKNISLPNDVSYSNIFQGINNGLTVCIDKENIFFQLLSSYQNNCSCYLNPEHKLIIDSNECIEDCSKAGIYIYEYNNFCYQSCPANTRYFSENNSCIDILCKNNFYNYEQTECIDTIPEGYYLNDTNLHTIDKCNIECGNCSLESNKNNLCISCNINNNYYPKYNDILNINSFIKCYNGQQEGYFLDYDIYMPCYNSCKYCTDNGNINNHQCISCKSGFNFIDLENDTNCYEICENYYYFDSDNNYHCTTEKKCPDNYNILIKDKNKCEYDPSIVITYKNEYTNNELSINFDKSFFTGNESNNKDNLINNIRKELTNSKLDDIINSKIIEEKQDLVFKEENIIYQLTSTDNQNNNEYNNISTINLGECETKLREEYKIDSNVTLLILKLDIYEEGLLIPLIEYEVYNSKTKEKLNLNVCKDIKINITIPVNIDEDNIFKYNSSNDYYNDICYSYASNNTDIIIEDRRNEYINNNMSLCESDCEYTKYDYIVKKVSCECSVKTECPPVSEIETNKKNLLINFIDLKNIININVIKCYKEVFKKDELKHNIGFYIMSTIIILTLILSILFKIKGYANLKNKINEISKNKIIGKKLNINSPIKNKRKKTEIKKKKKKNVNIIIFNNENKRKLKKKSKTAKDSITKFHLLKTERNINNKKPEIYNDYELNNLSYQEALKIDKRKYFEYYLSLLRMKHILIFTFYTYNDYNSKSIKIILFLFSFALSFSINTLFFDDSTIHKIHEDQGKFNLLYQIPNILYPTVISTIINTLIKYLSLTERNIIALKNEKNNIINKSIKLLKYLLIKLIIFFIIAFLFLILFWYYITCFCGVYKNTQIHLINDTLISCALSLVYPFLLYLIPGIFRIPSLNGKNQERLYKISQIIQII